MKHKKFLRFAVSLIAALGLSSANFLAKPNQAPVAAQSYSDKSLSHLKFHKQEIVTVDHNKPQFSKKTKSKKHGPWQHFSELDYLNRAHTANALLNKKLMPHSQRQALTWDPTGWHNKRIKGGWLYNRCHLIGYQLTGQNNNPRNLITGTRELNDPDMLKYEDKVADYIRRSGKHYVRYRVTPIYQSNNLLANGVEMEAQSIGDNSIHFNVFIFNEQPGMVLNYKTGTSKVKKSGQQAVAKIKKTHKKVRHARKAKKRVIHHQAGRISTANYRIIGNKRSKIYHVANGQNYHMSSANAVYFKSEAAARAAVYRKSLR
ncbi:MULTISPECIES: DNA/RNA non-specific endonuclease [Lactobacillus]|uniref:DNA-entry nuclease n=1 Tax=Lactobacillus xujianguonis TaxID=2495899 RepID=A0A437SUY2_9LACO|nr:MULTISPECIES: DNA/RNA non-specific endonuclease [Lactobacillus]RVU70743.1 DNA-entry nuclease [Lactobacillus xujianguonis]RVU73996.1 DNA-entry nuclease [Lactobacillus xujianguonis]